MVEFENMEQREVLETPNLEESPNETLDRKLRAYFDGKIVRKDLTKSIKEGANVPVYVLEFLIEFFQMTGNTCFTFLFYSLEESCNEKCREIVCCIKVDIEVNEFITYNFIKFF